MVMTVGLAIGSDVHQFRPGPQVFRKSGHDALGEALAVVKQVLERDGARDRTVVEEKRDFLSRGQGQHEGQGWIDALPTALLPCASSDLASPAGLPGSENREFDS